MARFKFYIEYEGTRYSGWQIQKNAKTIQGKIDEALKTIFKNKEYEFYGSGRTDSGVHALCQVAHLEINTNFSPEMIRMKINDLLPYDINIISVEKAKPNFHARHHAEKRSYIYQISKRRTAFGKNFVWWIKDKLDVEIMKKACNEFIGMHDFSSFSNDDISGKSQKVLISDVSITVRGDLIVIRIIGSHFLWKMVRRIIGVLVETGRGNFSIKDIKNFLKISSTDIAKFTAPPSGLFLEKAYYEGESEIDGIDSFITVLPEQEYKKKL
ncbi:MAG: tRNA pseudouridine(38-40) synthase TruA [Ignavibacteriales bacterium CG_4_9_14_3_um_filter_34_10]|nr:MAG: tRNA pseudouridine(38-40) synthase TruA [Ignavibacteriales bacterium CG_4_9_14_3_um_filter_34_10]